jgi:hypothetical protein
MNALPRTDLREPAFRRYEQHIAAALKGSTIIDPAPLKAVTFCARFKDACLGFEKYGYASDVIPTGAWLRVIKPLELPDGKVLLQNRALPPAAPAAPSNKQLFEDLHHRRKTGEHFITITGDDEFNALLELAEQYDVSLARINPTTASVI